MFQLTKYFYGSTWSFVIVEKMNNQFWKDVILAWYDLIKNIFKNNGDYNTNMGPLWYNPFISDTTIIPLLYSKGIISPIDLISANGELMTKESIAFNFNIYVDFLSCYRMISSLKNTCLTMQLHWKISNGPTTTIKLNCSVNLQKEVKISMTS